MATATASLKDLDATALQEQFPNVVPKGVIDLLSARQVNTLWQYLLKKNLVQDTQDIPQRRLRLIEMAGEGNAHLPAEDSDDDDPMDSQDPGPSQINTVPTTSASATANNNATTATPTSQNPQGAVQGNQSRNRKRKEPEHPDLSLLLSEMKQQNQLQTELLRQLVQRQANPVTNQPLTQPGSSSLVDLLRQRIEAPRYDLIDIDDHDALPPTHVPTTSSKTNQQGNGVLHARPSSLRACRISCQRDAHEIWTNITGTSRSATDFVHKQSWRDVTKMHEALAWARCIDLVADQFGDEAIAQIDAMETALRRLAAVLLADKTASWRVAAEVQENPEKWTIASTEIVKKAQAQAQLKEAVGASFKKRMTDDKRTEDRSDNKHHDKKDDFRNRQ